MKELNYTLLSTLLKFSAKSTRAIQLSYLDLGEIADDLNVLCENVELLDLSHNNFSNIDKFWAGTLFPQVWWINAAYNPILTFGVNFLPYVVGALNLTSSFDYSFGLLSILKSVHVLRLNLKKCSYPVIGMIDTKRMDIIQLFPLVWVLDDDYILWEERKMEYLSLFDQKKLNQVSNNQTSSTKKLSIFSDNSMWGIRQHTDKEKAILHVIQTLPFNGIAADNIKLCILLEDYLDQAFLYNKLFINSNDTIQKQEKKRYALVDVSKIMQLPHAIRLNLSVLLTASIVIPLPKALFKETLTRLLSDYMSIPMIQDLCLLPGFIKTAVVNIIRRTCYKEIEELNVLQGLTEKPSATAISIFDVEEGMNSVDRSTYQQSYIGSGGYRHLRPFLIFLERPLVRSEYTNNHSISNIENCFSDVELEILRVLPDIPTKASITLVVPSLSSIGTNQSESDQNSMDWVQVTARQTIYLMSSVYGFPSLTKSHSNARDQKVYDSLTPLLTAAKMTHSDLNSHIQADERLKTGRIPHSIRLNTTKKTSSNLERGASLLRFGVGLPKGTPEDLVWISTEREAARSEPPVLPDPNPISVHLALDDPPIEDEVDLQSVSLSVLTLLSSKHREG